MPIHVTVLKLRFLFRNNLKTLRVNTKFLPHFFIKVKSLGHSLFDRVVLISRSSQVTLEPLWKFLPDIWFQKSAVSHYHQAIIVDGLHGVVKASRNGVQCVILLVVQVWVFGMDPVHPRNMPSIHSCLIRQPQHNHTPTVMVCKLDL